MQVTKGLVKKIIAIVESITMQLTEIIRKMFYVRSLFLSFSSVLRHLVLNQWMKTKTERQVKSRKAMKTGDRVGFPEYGTPIFLQSKITLPRSKPSLALIFVRHHIGVSRNGIRVIYAIRKKMFILERYFLWSLKLAFDCSSSSKLVLYFNFL